MKLDGRHPKIYLHSFNQFSPFMHVHGYCSVWFISDIIAFELKRGTDTI